MVINLTRFGDLLQTQPVFSGLKARGERTGLVCLDSFQGAARLLRDVDQVRVLPGAKLLARLDQSWAGALVEFASWLDGAADRERIVNLTPTLPARLLGRVLGGVEVEGFALDDHGFGQHSTPWAVFLQAASTYRGCSPFNLVDLFQRVAGLAPGEFRLRTPESEALKQADELLSASPGQGYAGLQLGASQDYRRWPVTAFVRAARVLWTHRKLSPVLLGTASESHLAREFMALADFPCTDLTGQTNLPTLAAVLSRMELLLTNDTGTMHLAAGLGVPVAAVFLATAQPFDTGPYLEGSISLEPDLPCHPCSFGQECPHGLACRDLIDGERLGVMLAGHLASGSWDVPSGLGARVWQAKRDEQGFMDLFSLSGHDTVDRSRWIRIQRDIYRQFLDQSWNSTQPFWPGAGSAFRDGLEEDLRRCLLLLTLIEEQGRLLTVRPDAPVRAKFLVNCQHLEDQLARNQAMGVLGPMWRFQSQDQSVSLAAFLTLCGTYRELFSVLLRRVALA